MFENPPFRLPTIYVTARDRNRLEALLTSQHRFIPDTVHAELRRELARAVVCDDDDIPRDVVTMNSRALFRAHPGGELQSRTLIYDEDHSTVGGTISVITTTGAALLGLRAGSRMPYVTRDGERRMLVVEDVVYQPEAQARLGGDPYRRWPPRAAPGGDMIALRPQPPARMKQGDPDGDGPDAA
jgi:regulator of nucleoside diphosphate kinase